jgi:hypothetical protein
LSKAEAAAPIATEVALYHDKEQHSDILTHGLPLRGRDGG